MCSIKKFIVPCPTTGCPSLRRQQIRVERTWSQEWNANCSSTSFWESLGLFIKTSGLHCFICKHFSPDQVAPFLNTYTQLKGQCTLLNAIKVALVLLPAVLEKNSFILKALRILYQYRLSAYQYKFPFFYYITFKSWTDLSSRWRMHLEWPG